MGNDNWLVEKEKENIKGFLTFKSLHFLSFHHLRKPLRQKPIVTSSDSLLPIKSLSFCTAPLDFLPSAILDDSIFAQQNT